MPNTIPQKLVTTVEDTPLAEAWDASARTFPLGPIPFLQHEFVEENARWASLDHEAVAYIQAAAKFIGSDPDFTRLVWHCHHLLFVEGPGKYSPSDWPLLTDLLGEYGGAFYLLVILSGLPAIRRVHADLGIPEKIARDTFRDTLVWAKQYHKIGVQKDDTFVHPSKPHVWGLGTRAMPWLLGHLYGRLYRVGRLQYRVGPHRQKLLTYRHRSTGVVRLLAEPGLRFRGDGLFDGTAGIEDPERAWKTELTEESGRVTGTAIHPEGRALRSPVTLDLNSWELVLREGDQILEIHIPEDGPMDFDGCGESLRDVIEFFPRYHPERAFKAIVCTSWFLDRTYQQLLPERSNIVRFQKECYLFPFRTERTQYGLQRIFGPYSHDLSTAPRDTSMRRAVLDHFSRGGVLVGGGALILPESLDWGKQVYLRSFE